MYAKKEKNIITFTTDEGRNYVFDINSLICYGLSGKPLKRIPKDLQYCRSDSIIISMVTEMFRSDKPILFQRYATTIQFADKLSSMGYDKKTLSTYTVHSLATVIGKTKYEKVITEKMLLNYIKKTEPEEISYDNFINAIRDEYFAKAITVELNEKELNLIKQLMKYEYTVKEIKLIANWFSKGMAFFYDFSVYEVDRVLKRFFSRAKDIEYTPTKDDFFRQAVTVYKNYEMRKEEIDNRKLVENQTAKNLNFENDDLIVIVPTTSKEFEFEGNSQSNCVFTSYLREVILGTTNVVFIRKKSDVEKSYITCEVRNGRISQYLTKFNNSVYDDFALTFKRQYQNYLNEVFTVNY